MLTLSSSFPDPFLCLLYQCFSLKTFSDNLLRLRTKVSLGYMVLLIAVPMARVIILLSFILLQGRAEETNNLCAKLAVGSLFSQYHQATVRDKKNSVRYLMTKQLP